MSDLGRVVRKGRIRVDARKAMAKLREHLLVDLHFYAIEVVRSAVLAGATAVDVQYDADDVLLHFDGQPLTRAELPRLFEHLVGGEEEQESRHMRLLALATNAALGLDPAWIAIVSADMGRALRVTWTPALVSAIEREEKPLPEVDDVVFPAGMPATGTLFHFRRKMGWDIVRRAAAKTVPREVALLIEAASSLRIPIYVNGEAPAPPRRPKALARAPLTLPGVKRAHVEIVDTTTVAPHVEFCELGLLLSRAGLAFGSHFPMSEHLGIAPPVRLVIDSDALPTNASRSAVREDAPLFGSLRSAAAPALSDAILGLVAAAFGKGTVPDGVTIEADDKAVLREALGAFVCAAEASLIARVPLPEALRVVLTLPHFEDGLGRPITHADIPRADPLLVWRGKDPVPEEMTPWAHHVVWLRERVAERILSSRVTLPPEQLVEIVKRGVDRKKKLLAMPAGPASVPDGDYLARERFAFTKGPFAGLSGEVAIASDPLTYVRNLALRVFLEGRCFEAFPVPEDVVPLPCLIALEWPAHITPKLAYEGVEPTAGLRAALAFAIRAAVLACERFAQLRLRSSAPFDKPRAAILRAALGTAVLAPTKMYSAQGFEMPALDALDALLHAPIWPTTERAAAPAATPSRPSRLVSGPPSSGSFASALRVHVSLQTLCEYAAKTGTICVATPATPGRAADGRPVVGLPANELSWLSLCLRPGITILRYDAALLAAQLPPRQRSRPQIVSFIDDVAAASLAPILHVEDKSFAFAATLGASETRVWHGGVEILRSALDVSFGGMTLAIDDDSIVPSADWKGVVHADDPRLTSRAEQMYGERLVAALLGDEAARNELFRRIGGASASRYAFPDHLASLPASVQRFLIDRAERGRRRDASPEDRELAARIELLPFLTILGDTGEPIVTSLATIASLYPDRTPIPTLRSAPAFRPIGWRPLIVFDTPTLEALARWSGDRLQDGSADLLVQGRRAERTNALTEFRKRPPLDPKAIGPRGDATGPLVHLPAIPRHAPLSVTAALAVPSPLLPTHAVAEILFEDRLACEIPLPSLSAPVVARVSLLDPEHLETTTVLTPEGAAAVSARVQTAALALALDILERARTPGKSRLFFGDLRALRLVHALLFDPKRDARLENALRHPDLKWPTVQGADCPYVDLAQIDGALWGGIDLFASWLPPAGAATDLDRPILHLPGNEEGVTLARILERTGVRLRSVTAEIAALQQKRASGSSDRPRLAARPVHPSLAQDLHALQLTGIDGELAIYESGESACEVTALDGYTRRIQIHTSFPARAVARVEILTTASTPELSEKLTRAAVRLLVGLIPSLDALPPFVRAHLRGVTCAALSKDKTPPAPIRRAPVFPDIDGAFFTLDQLQSGDLGDLSCTFDPGPYPRTRQEGKTLVLTPTEHLQLVRKLKILNVTEWMRRDFEAERRREAPPVSVIRFDDEARGHMLASTLVKEGALEGEIGLLAPASAGARSIQVLTTRRPLCKLDDSPGWPVAAVLNDDTLHPTRWFDGLLPADETALRARVRSLADRLVRDTLARDLPAEHERLATLFLDEAIPPMAAYGSTDPITATGYLYVPATWPVAPTVRILVQGFADLGLTPIFLAQAPISASLPLGGALCISHASPEFSRGAACRLALALRGVLERMLAPLLRPPPAAGRDSAVPKALSSELQAYAWNLRLLGSTTFGVPAALSAAGTPVSPDDLIASLQSCADLWLTDRRGSIDGDFPEGTPPFVLVDDGSPLTRVLRARVPASRFKHLGAAPLSRPSEALAPPSVRPPPNVETATFDAAATQKTSRSWLSSVLGKVTGLLSGAPEGPAPAPTGVGAAVERALRALRLREEPVLMVDEVLRGPLVRYDQRMRAVLINVAHPALARHIAAASPTAMRRVCVALVAAALSEVNIALENVTDHDESQALLELLRQEAAPGI